MRKLLFLLYGLYLSAFLFFSYSFIDPNLFYLNDLYSGFSFSERGLTSIIFASIIFASFIFYFIFIFFLKKKIFKVEDLKILIILTVVILFLSYPAMISYDIFNYMASAKVLFFYRENPFIIMPIEFTKEPLLLFMHAANKTALYGFFWLFLTGIPHVFGFNNFILTLFSFKIFNVLFYAFTVVLIWKFSKNTYSVLLFALNPLVVIETLISSHNDIVMMFFALFSFYLLYNRKIYLALLFIIMSVFIKYATIFLLPVFAIVFYKTIKKEKINWDKVFLWSFILMLLIFLLSSLREEIYPWYAIWFLIFIVLIPKYKLILYSSIALSFGLMLRYIPYMYTGTYFGITPMLKTVFTFLPLLIPFMFKSFFKKI